MLDTLTTRDSGLDTLSADESRMFNGEIAARVVNLLTTLDINATLDHFEPGMFQVRIDPLDRTQPHGWIAVAGTDNDRVPGWVVMQTTLDAAGFGFYDTTEDCTPIRLYLPVSAEPAQVAIALMTFLAKRSGR